MEATTDRAQKYYEQLVYDAYYRGRNASGQVTSVDGRMRFVSPGVDGAMRWTDAEEDEPADYHFNLFRRSVRQFTALFGVRAPNARFVPVNPRDHNHIYRARLAGRVSRAVDVTVNARALQSRLSNLLARSGTVFGHTRWVSSKRYGERMIPRLVEESLELAPPYFECECGAVGEADALDGGYCRECGRPVGEDAFDGGLSATILMESGEYDKRLNGAVECTLYTEMNVSVPDGAGRLEDCGWLALNEEKDRAALAEAYDVPVSAIKPFSHDGIDDASGAHARRQALSRNGGAAQYRDRATEGKYWLTPDQFGYIADDYCRDQARAEFPDGVKICVVPGAPPRLEPENLLEVWTACLPEEDDRLSAGPYMADVIGMSDIYNDAMTIAVEAAERSIPINLFDPDIVGSEDLRRHGRKHSTFIPAKQRGRDPGTGIARFAPAEFRPEMVNLAESIFTKNDEIQGMLPTIWGSPVGVETAYEAESTKNQALAMLAIPWLHMRTFHENVRRQAVLQIAKYSDGRLYLPVSKHPGPENYIDVASPEELDQILLGGWTVESDEAMPMSSSQIAQRLTHIMTQMPPQVAEQLGLFDPSNLPIIAAHLSLPDLKSPLVEMVEAVQQLVEELLGEEPAPMPDGSMAASRELDGFLYDPQVVLAVAKPWIVSDEGRAERERNPAGWENLKAFIAETEAMLAPPPEMPPGPEAEGAAPPAPEAMPVTE